LICAWNERSIGIEDNYHDDVQRVAGEVVDRKRQLNCLRTVLGGQDRSFFKIVEPATEHHVAGGCVDDQFAITVDVAKLLASELLARELLASDLVGVLRTSKLKPGLVLRS